MTSRTLGRACSMVFVRHSGAKGAIGRELNPVNIGFAYSTNSHVNSLCVKQRGGGKEKRKKVIYTGVPWLNDGLNPKSKTCDKRWN